MSVYYVSSIEVSGLWGYRDFSLRLDPAVNILIGPNGSGKTTILTLLRSVLSVDLMTLASLEFRSVSIRLRGFEGKSVRTVSVVPTDEGLRFRVSQRTFDVSLPSSRRPSYVMSRLRRKLAMETGELAELLRGLVPAAWLPVSRRLPIAGDEEEEGYGGAQFRRSKQQLESVDERLRELTEDLVKYRLRLDAQLSERYKRFEKQVLRLILYSPEEDRLGTLSVPSSGH